MSLFGEKCARCGTRTRHEHDGGPMCESCEQEVQLLVSAEGEIPRKCPIDGNLMQKEVSHMIVIDRCPKCAGVWLDGGELERMKGGVEEDALLAMSRSFIMPIG